MASATSPTDREEPPAQESSGSVASSAGIGRAGRAEPGQERVYGAILSIDPPIVLTTFGWPDRMRWIEAFEPVLGSRQALVLCYTSWHWTNGITAKWTIARFRHYRRQHPQREVHLLVNAPDEIETMARFGEPAKLLNHNLFISEAVFRPVNPHRPTYDAIYVARMAPTKRIELAAAIDRVAYVLHIPDAANAWTKRTRARLETLAPSHTILNVWDGDKPLPLKAGALNLALADTAVGLCLSEVEGAMRASMEYLLAGLAVVTTPSLGGRDFYFDAEYCLTVPPNPRSVRDAVIALRDRQIPRQYIRERTLARLEPQRRAFLGMLDGFLERHAHATRFSGTWPWPDRRTLCRYETIPELLEAAERGPAGRPGRTA